MSLKSQAVCDRLRRRHRRGFCGPRGTGSQAGKPGERQGRPHAEGTRRCRERQPDTEGLGRLAEIIRAKLAGLGAKAELVDVNAAIVKMHDAPPAVGKVVVARFEGGGSRRIMLLGRMDTVYPRGTLAKRPFRIEGGRAFGPGIADDKGGIALILHSLTMLKSLGFRDYRMLTVVINADEEISTLGARDLITRLGAAHDVVLSCEPPLTS